VTEPEKCPDCGRELTESHEAFVNQWEPGRPELCYPYVNFGGSELCAERSAELLKSKLATLQTERDLLAKLDELSRRIISHTWEPGDHEAYDQARSDLDAHRAKEST
jgi:hypothetical protein